MSLDVSWASLALLGVFILLGLLVYERRGLRLGGVLVLPLLVSYALLDLAVLPVFGMAAAVAYGTGEAVHRRTLLYGRRVFVVFLLLGVVSMVAAEFLLGLHQGGLLMALLPGLFAFNLHREGTPARSSGLFLVWLGVFVLLGAGALLALGIETPGTRVLGPPLIAALLAIDHSFGGALAALVAVLGAPFAGAGAAASALAPLQAQVAGAPGAVGLSALGVLEDLWGGDAE